jgi:hypothetical protein
MEFPFNSLVFGASVMENCFLTPKRAFENTSKNPTLVPVLLSAIVCIILSLPALVLARMAYSVESNCPRGTWGATAVRIFEPIVSPAGTSLRELSELGAACRTTEETEENVGVA